MLNDNPSLEHVSTCVLGAMGDETDPNWMFTQWKIKKVKPRRLSGCISCLSGWSRPVLKVLRAPRVNMHLRSCSLLPPPPSSPLTDLSPPVTSLTTRRHVKTRWRERTVPPRRIVACCRRYAPVTQPLRLQWHWINSPSFSLPSWSHFTARNMHQSRSHAHAISSANINTPKKQHRLIQYSPPFIFTKQGRR